MTSDKIQNLATICEEIANTRAANRAETMKENSACVEMANCLKRGVRAYNGDNPDVLKEDFREAHAYFSEIRDERQQTPPEERGFQDIYNHFKNNQFALEHPVGRAPPRR